MDTVDARDVMWSSDDSVMCVWDSSLDYTLCIHAPDGRHISTYSAYKDALAIKVS